MSTLLLPCDGSSDSLVAVRRVTGAVRDGGAHEIHLINVQPRFSAHIAQHVNRATLADFHRDQAERALANAREILDAAGVTYHVHVEVGDTAACIADLARRLQCDRIVLATARKGGLARAISNSLTNRLLEISTVPVEAIAVDHAGVFD